MEEYLAGLWGWAGDAWYWYLNFIESRVGFICYGHEGGP